MQRIDENTYIDDTLVTCAEYQLFIDEMREQGKYYQPDHWTSFQFPEGKAREPIVGVRFSDAQVFCQWLTQRNGSEWQFRLPTQVEAIEHSILYYDQLAIGNWVVEKDGVFQFFWIYELPTKDDEKSIDVLNLDLECNRVVATFNDLRKNGPNNYYNRKNAQDLVSDLGRIINRTLDQGSWANLRSFMSRVLTNARSLSYSETYELTKDILRWQDRIVGVFPAFEGIRLIKYREQS